MKHVFLCEIDFQARCAAKAAEHLTQEGHRDPIDTWNAIHSILIAAGNVSKILWPQSKSARGAVLRRLLNVDEDNPLSNRSFRNHFEHYDERIEDWFSSPKSAVYVDQIVGPLPGLLGSFPQNAHRAFDPSTQILTFRGESMNLGRVIDALAEIRTKSRSVTQLDGWLGD